MKHVIFAAAVLAAQSALALDGEVRPLEPCGYATTQAARAAWRPAEKGTPPVELASADGRAAIKLPCNFRTNDAWRVSWDLAAPGGRWDLAACQTIRVELTVDGDAAADMILYFHSGDGWYGRSFAAPPGKRTIELPRQKFEPEDKPGGWDRVDRMRLSVVNREPEDRTVLLGGISAARRIGRIAVYRNDAGVRDENGVPQFVAQLSDRLERLGLGHDILGDDEVAAGKLAGHAVAILPLNPVLPKEAAVALEKFVAGGGKLLACYRIPAPLDKLLGVTGKGAIQGEGRLFAFTFEASGGESMKAGQQSWLATRVALAEGTKVRGYWVDKAGKRSDDAAITQNAAGFFVGHVLTATDDRAKDRIVREMLGELWPGLWEEAYRQREARLGRLAGFGGAAELAEAARAMAKSSENAPSVEKLLAESAKLSEDAKSSAKSQNYAAAARVIEQADAALLSAYATSIPSKAGEFRGVWCHSPHGLAGSNWDDAMKRLADAGFNAALPNMLWGGAAAFDSKVLPRATDVDRDLLAECVAAAKRHGIAVHVWKVNWNLWYNCPPKFKEELRKAGRLQADASGKTIDWLCPSHPANQKLELDSLVDLTSRYDIAGIHFDYIRYPGDGGCFCAGCRERFEADTGKKAANWPADVTAGPLKERYRQFRRDSITKLVAATSEQVRKTKPGVKISAAVFWHWPSARNSVGQDWKLWVDKGYLDFVCPMQYTDDAAVFASQMRQTARWAGQTALMPGIGATLGLSPDGTLRQVLAARGQGSGGFVLFNYEPNLLAHLELLKLGATRK